MVIVLRMSSKPCLPRFSLSSLGLHDCHITISIIIINIIIIITRPWPAYGRHGLAGLLGGDQSGRINSSHSIIEELARFARSDWMRLSGGDQSERINSSHFIIDHFSTCQNNFSTCQNSFSTCRNIFSTCQNNFSTCQKNFPLAKLIFPPAKIIFPH